MMMRVKLDSISTMDGASDSTASPTIKMTDCDAAESPSPPMSMVMRPSSSTASPGVGTGGVGMGISGMTGSGIGGSCAAAGLAKKVSIAKRLTARAAMARAKEAGFLGTSDGFVLELADGVAWCADVDCWFGVCVCGVGGGCGFCCGGWCCCGWWGEVGALGEECGGGGVGSDEELAGAGGEECELGVFGELLLVMDRDRVRGCTGFVAVVADDTGSGCDGEHGDRERDHHPDCQLHCRGRKHLHSQHICV